MTWLWVNSETLFYGCKIRKKKRQKSNQALKKYLTSYSLTQVLSKCFCIFLKPNVLYNRLWYIYLHLWFVLQNPYLSAFIICYTGPINIFVIWPLRTSDSIMIEKYKLEKGLPSDRARHNKEKKEVLRSENKLIANKVK